MSQSTIQKSAAEENAAVQTEAAVNKGQADVLDQLLKPEVQEALTVLVDNLPKLSEMVTVLTKTYDVAQSLLTDDVLKEDLLGGVKEFIEPVEGTVKGLAATAIEANDRAEANASNSIGLFGLLRILKDPQAQKLFRFAQAYLDITNEKQK
ncbi:DUF1641 domain-containing protein [Priestia megaterium]|uniref:DUF1641 domain-containing protein n=1 Tax=Priestia megaterium TaxID=1404 RepID=A0A6M6DUY5_PRIMG|nr:DUF1641 domain-containing protein [Priestia megaterium]QJX77246.1 DUF1641 domain-containing protein [Priestia megaterium]